MLVLYRVISLLSRDFSKIIEKFLYFFFGAFFVDIWHRSRLRSGGFFIGGIGSKFRGGRDDLEMKRDDLEMKRDDLEMKRGGNCFNIAAGRGAGAGFLFTLCR